MTSLSVTRCRACSSPDLRLVLSLGQIALVNAYVSSGEPREPEKFYPHDMLLCGACGLAQLGINPPSEEIFPASYPYRSGTTRALRENFADLAADAYGGASPKLKPDDLVLDIGSNDGTLLKSFRANQRVLGVTPEDIGQSSGVPTIQAYWTRETAARVVAEHGKPRLITACNVAAHVPDIHEFFGAMVDALADDGKLCLEVQDFAALVEGNQFDHVYVEHQMWWSADSLRKALARHGMGAAVYRQIPTHGGSVRAFFHRRPTPNERYDGDPDVAGFAERVASARNGLRRVVANIRETCGRIVGVGAPSRAGTLIGYTGLSADDMPEIWEHPESHKVGKFMPGTSIKVVAEPADLSATGYDFALLLNHHLAGDMKLMLRAKGWAGKFITPLPEVRVE
jgi:hypothetical protein